MSEYERMKRPEDVIDHVDNVQEVADRINQMVLQGAPADEIEMRLIEDCFLYLKNAHVISNYNELGIETISTVKACLKSYNPEKGDFLGYFLRAMKNASKQVEGIISFDQKTQGTVSLQDYESVRRTRKKAPDLFKQYQCMASLHPELDDEGIIQKLAKSNNMKPGTILKALRVEQVSTVQAISENEDGEEYNLIDEVAAVGLDGNRIQEKSVTKNDYTYKRAEKLFLDQKKDVKKRQISVCFTVKILNQMMDQLEQTEVREELARIRKLSIFDEEVFAIFLKEKSVPELKELAVRNHWIASDLSRTWKNFLLKMKRS